MMRIAALPMYDLPELREATDAYWSALAERLRARGMADVPDALSRPTDLHALWTDPSLLLAQTCGYPLATSLRGKVALVATPCYDAEGCEGPYGRSAIIVRATDRAHALADFRGRICAVNSPDSNSGMNLLRAAIAPLAGGRRFFATVKMTGGHSETARVVAEGEADVAAIDCVTWALLRQHRPSLTAKLRVLDWTQATPWLPLISVLRFRENDVVAEALQADKMLLISSYARLASDEYDRVTRIENEALDQAYPVVA